MPDTIKNLSRREIIIKLQSLGVPLSDVFNISFLEKIPDWGKEYKLVKSGQSFYERPDRDFCKFDIKLHYLNPLNLNDKSTGIYAIYENSKCIYVGKTNNNIVQRFDAHISKIFAINNNKHHHPKNWQRYAKDRFENKNGGVDISDFFVKFYPLMEYYKIFNNISSNDNIDHMEAMIYYGKKQINNEFCFLNHEPSVGNKSARAAWRDFFASATD